MRATIHATLLYHSSLLIDPGERPRAITLLHLQERETIYGWLL